MTGQCPTPTDLSSANSSDAEPPTPLPSPPTGSRPTSPKSTPTSPSNKSTDPPSESSPSVSPTSDPLAVLLPITSIDLADPTNARFDVDEDAIRTLARDIAANGLYNPITVRQIGDRYRLVAGATRYRAHIHLARTHIPARVLGFDDLGESIARLSENVQRSNLTPVEEAVQLADAVERHPQGTDGVAERLGRNRGWVEDRLELLTYPEELRAAVHKKTISLAAAKHLAKISDPADRVIAIEQAALHGISARTAAEWLRQSRCNLPPENTTSENVPDQPHERFNTTTFATCFACTNDVDIVGTITVRICQSCLDHIKQAMNPQPQLMTPTQRTPATAYETNQHTLPHHTLHVPTPPDIPGPPPR